MELNSTGLVAVTFKNQDTETIKYKTGKVSTQTARMLYANTFSDKVGIVKGYKKDDNTEELSLLGDPIVSGNELILTFNKGAVSIYGGIGIIEQGATVNVPQNITDYSFGIVVNLGNQAGNEMEFYCKPGGELRQDDLQINDVDGVYEFELFKITTTASTYSITSKTNKYIYSVKDYLEDRIKRLGFFKGSMNLASGVTAVTNIIKRQGNYVIGHIKISQIKNTPFINLIKSGIDGFNLGYLPRIFAPHKETFGNNSFYKTGIIVKYETSSSYPSSIKLYGEMLISKGGGNVEIRFETQSTVNNTNYLQIVTQNNILLEFDFGYEGIDLTNIPDQELNKYISNDYSFGDGSIVE